MMFWIASGAGLAIAYLFGSLPTGYLAGKLLRGIDIRAHGSKSTGATNVLRTLGTWPALVVLLIDVAKGAAAIVFALWFYPWLSALPSVTPPTAPDLQTLAPWAVCLAGLAALLGHGRSIWLNFSGGKSAATGLGVLLAMSWPVGLGAAAVFGVVLSVFRIVSLGSMLAALADQVLGSSGTNRMRWAGVADSKPVGYEAFKVYLVRVSTITSKAPGQYAFWGGSKFRAARWMGASPRTRRLRLSRWLSPAPRLKEPGTSTSFSTRRRFAGPCAGASL